MDHIRDANGVEADLCVRISSNNVLPLNQEELASSGVKPESVGRIWQLGSHGGHEAVAIPVHGLDELGVFGVLVERAPNIRDEQREVGGHDERVGPEVLVDVLLLDDLRTVLQQEGEQSQCLRCQMHRLGRSRQFEPIGVDAEIRELNPHCFSDRAADYRKSCDLPGRL